MPRLEFVSLSEKIQMIEMKAVLAGNAALKQLAAVQKEWRKGMNATGKQMLRYYNATTENWTTEVKFRVKSGREGENPYVQVWAENRIYWFVHESISVMRGVLSGPKDPAGRWRPKTRPGRLRSGHGSGRLVYASKQVSKPPYKAREFTKLIIKREQKPFEKRMQHATAVGARKATQGG
jgi:hypothetical protein